ncbi:hypothetical protein Fcan01_19695 [Folsomia candida]|uniref:MRH domain-containing protein n=1 Tax=Folsomia candida TaxID=158441 RepID=A0A226DJG9_FOLCA|nr:hypothetical protein Fcan01_19695 [Folsomia candida]
MKIFLRLVVLLSFWCFVHSKRSRKLETLSSCSPDDYRYEFTDCDAAGGRWRVAVPENQLCEDVLPPIPPRRLNECYKSCDAGQFLNLTSLECEDCSAGTYSLGGGIVFDEYEHLPPGFKVQVEKFRSMFSSIGRQYSNVNCSKYGWKTRKDMVVSQGGPCVAILVYTAQLVKPGRLKFTYQYADDSVLFQFQANSDQCESLREAEGSRWPVLTGDGVWRTEEIMLHTGLNIFQWKTMGIEASHRPKPVMIKRIEIEGVGYTSSCNPCPAGTYNNQEASKMCLPCAKDTFSLHQSTNCIPCDRSTYYSEPGSDSCTPRPACSETDYYQIHQPCRNNRTQITYEWVRPKICLETKLGAVSLPPPGEYIKCPPCNAGTEYRDGSCKPCKSREFSDGVTPCMTCPRDTEPSRGHHLTQWYSWPESLHITCISPEDTGCSNSPSWELHGNYTQTGKGHAKWVYLVMTLSVGGFRGIGRIINGELHEVGRVTFQFEMSCANDCELLFMQGTSSKNATVIQRWIGSHAFEEFSHPIYRNSTYDFSWAFQKLAWDSAILPEDGMNTNSINYQPVVDRDEENYVKIYQINVKNSIDGGASSCIPCHEAATLGHNIDTCTVCDPKITPPSNDNDAGSHPPTGSESESTSSSWPSSPCLPCPIGHVRVDPFSTDSKSCRPCGPGLITMNGVDCVTDCTIKRDSFIFDLRPLKGTYTVRGSSLFTASGTQYFHVFNISLCSDSYATCEKNVSAQHGIDPSSRVEALICQSTIFPPALSSGSSMEPDSSSSGYSDGYSEMIMKPLSTHASSLGDHLMGISPAPSILGIPIADDIRNQILNTSRHQLHFFYSTPERTIACPTGRSTTITFRCKVPTATWNFLINSTSISDLGVLKTLEGCSDGTCDGCNFHFIWETPFACHVCSEDELTIVKGECKSGMQDVHYLPSTNSECLPRINSTWPTLQKCVTHLPFLWEVAVQIAGGMAGVLLIVIICFWRRHRKLEYKYMKLVASGSSRGNHSPNTERVKDVLISERDMMPVAESCALDPNDDDDDEEIYGEPGTYLLWAQAVGGNKLKSLTRKGETGSSLEIMNLTDKEACS